MRRKDMTMFLFVQHELAHLTLTRDFVWDIASDHEINEFYEDVK